jgi:arylsulfatase A-like enzyme
MIQKKNLQGYFCLFFLLNLLSCNTKKEVAETPDPNPNIIIMYADDLGYGDLGSYGGDIPTPNIDRLGKEGIRFTDFYVSAPVCTPSRYSLLTGRYPHRAQHGLSAVIMPGDDHHFDESELTLAQLLHSRGYGTAIIGKWHLGANQPSYLPMQHGFELFTGHKGGCIDYFYHVYGGMGNFWFVNGTPAVEEGYSTELITDHALDFIEKAREKTTPFFLYLPYNAPHFGKTDPDSIPEVTVSLFEGTYKDYKIMNSLQAPEKYVQQFSHREDPYRRTYSAMVASLDENVGRVLDKLEEEGLSENTMIWFISDNGGYAETYHGHASNGPLKGEKATLWEGGIRVPALLRWKGKIAPNQVVAQPVCNVDIVPTLGAITGYADTLQHLPIDGRDISQVLFDQQTLERDIFWQYGEQTAFRRGDWKLHNFDELYNLKSDIGEQNNLAAQHPDKLQELQQAYEQIANDGK